MVPLYVYPLNLLGVEFLSELVRKPDLVRPATLSTGRTVALCVHCGSVAQREAVFKQGGISVVEKYCEDCLKTENFSAIMTFYARLEKRRIASSEVMCH